MNIKHLSINKDKLSDYWFVSFTGPDGRMKRRSTKVPHAGGTYNGEKLTAKQAEKRALQVGTKIAEDELAAFEEHNNISVRDFLLSYQRTHSSRLATGSYRNDKSAFALLLAFLGKKADLPLRLLSRADARAFMEHRRAQVRASTTRRDIGSLKTAFEHAVLDDITPVNVWRGIRVPAERLTEADIPAEAFTIEELRYIISHFPEEWSSAVRCSFETYGQRLGDIRLLRWKQFDWEARVVRFVTGKTGRVLAQPMRDAFYEWARAKYESSGRDDEAYVHPRLAANTSSVSWEFTMLLEAHGLIRREAHAAGNRRKRSNKTFHSIRRSAATLLQGSGVAQGITTKLVGHASEAIHELYVRPDTEILRAAAELMPAL